MPRIRKETSNRRSTNDRAKRRKQVKESKRKAARAAKKNPQWKSRTPKDPGIPSEFPYKDQILAEVAEQRRVAAEEKERKKEEKARNLARARAIARGEIVEDDEDENEGGSADEEGSDVEDAEDDIVDEETGKSKSKKDLNVGAESIAHLSAKLVGTKIKARPKPAPAAVEEEEVEEDVPVLLNRDLPNLKAVLDKADVVIEVLDGRDPAAFRSKHLEELAHEMGKKTLLVLSKIDACPREAVSSWTSQLRSEQPTLLFQAASAFLPEQPTLLDPLLKKGKGKAGRPKADNAVGAEAVRSCLAHWAKEKGDEPLAVAVVGVTNVGKSAFVNSLLKRSALPVYSLASSSRGPTTTELPQEVILDIEDQQVLLIDTPGLSFVNDEDDEPMVSEQRRARDILLRSKGRIDRLKDPNPPVEHLVSRANSEDLMLLYSLPAFLKNDTNSFLSGVARANQLVKKKGEPDLTGAARIVLRDWSIGKLSHYTTPPTTNTLSSSAAPPKQDAFLAELYAKDAAILEAIPTRKERRKQGGLVKLMALPSEKRKAAVEADWAGLQNDADEESDDGSDDAEGVNGEGMDVDSEEEAEEEASDEEEAEDDEEGEEEEVVAPPPKSNKQKRKAVEPAPERPSKKVAFNPLVKAKAAKPLKAVQAAAKDKDAAVVAPAKTALKAKSVTKKPSENKAAKVANKPSTKKAASLETKKSDNAPQAYDFGKFF